MTEAPVGHPEIITENFDDISTYFGDIKCKVLPPRGLLHPVLPHRAKNKLMFPLCKTCADQADPLNRNPCAHTDEERALEGTWAHTEIMKSYREKGTRSFVFTRCGIFQNIRTPCSKSTSTPS